LQEIILQKLTQFLQENNVLDAPASNTDGFLLRDNSFFNLAEQAYLEQNKPFSTLKILLCWKYSFQKLTQFSQGNNVLDAPASSSLGFLWELTCVSSTQLIRPIWNKISLSAP
jgi:hypothetical protein